ncbi:MAG: M28 family peptidase [Bdellovibrionota bacterium]
MRPIVYPLLIFTLFSGCSSVHIESSPSSVAQPERAQISTDLKRTIRVLASDIGERNLYHPEQLERAASLITSELQSRGYPEAHRIPVLFDPSRFQVAGNPRAFNIQAELKGTSADLIVIGAHYDSKVAMPGWHDHWPPTPNRPGTPGANDNASGIAALLYLAGALRQLSPTATIRFVAFVNEEPPFFQTSAMGSLSYAEALYANGEQNVRMISSETLGCFSSRKRKKRVGIVSLFGLDDSSSYIAFLGNMHSRPWMEHAATAFSARIGHRPFAGGPCTL